MKKRPPVVTVMGHIDHGKTTLLDKIRQSHVADGEQGGITQHIGAYQIEHQGQKITFIDTPGHVAFSKMRARGAQVTDLIVLVIAANDGVMPQTKESLEHIKAAKVPFLVAINKMDVVSASSQKVKEQLEKEGVLVEGFGGDVVCVEVSAKTGKGINELLEMILLLAEMAELQGNPADPFEAVVIESSLDSRKGPLVTLLVKNGSLKVGEEIKGDDFYAKVKAMFDENGQRVDLVKPSQPVEVLGFKNVPPVGSLVIKATKKIAGDEAPKGQSLLVNAPGETEAKLKLILKSDAQGTLEAIVGNLPEGIQLIFKGVGDVNESDLFLAETTGAEIIGFNVKIPNAIKKLAKTEKVKISSFQVIYELFDALQKRLSVKEEKEEVLGEAEIIAEFEFNKEKVAGCRVKKGRITKIDRLRLQRGEKVLGDLKIKSMQHKKEAIDEAKEGQEFGAIFSSSIDFKIGDVIIAHRINNGSES